MRYEERFCYILESCQISERHHKVRILDEALHATVKLSRRYIPTRQLPDKGVSILDTACAKVALSQGQEPSEVEYTRRRIEALKLELDILKREEREGFSHPEELKSVEGSLKAEEQRYAELTAKLAAIRAKADEYFALRGTVGPKASAGAEGAQDAPQAVKADAQADVKADAGDAARAPQETQDETARLARLHELRTELNTMQGESPMLLPEVDAQAVSTVISEWTGIPLGRMVKDEIKSVLGLSSFMQERVIGQAHALDVISRRLLTARAALADPNRPIAVLMLAGPSGVGKTETALALAEQLYGTESNLITINMSEFQEAHTVSTLKGAPPGYVGYGEGGVLTEAVRRRPYSVVLLDEVEKAHKDVHEIFFQVFDKGQMEDGSGRLINFRNCVILLTTNVGDEEILRLCEDEEHLPDLDTLADAVMPAMRRVFPAALLGRINIVPYYPLGKTALNHIIDLKLGKIVRRVRENYGATLSYTQGLRDEIIARCNNIASGARLIDAIVNNTLLPEVSARFLEAAMNGQEVLKMSADAREHEFVYEMDTRAREP